MLLSRGDPNSVRILLECIEDFGNKSGLRMNVLKSNIFMAGIKEPDTRNILSFSNLSQGSMPFRYLGIPLTAERLKVAHFEELTRKIRTYIDGWSALTLSYAGRAELIRSVLQGVECYWISIFPLPDAVCTKIIKLCRNFLWGTSSKKVAWASICHPKSEGGLGFRDLRAWNNALLAKTLWNIHAKKDTLWHKWIQHVYLRNRPLRDWNVQRDDSPLLKNLHRIKEKMLQHFGSWDRVASQLNSWRDRHKIKGRNQTYEFFRPAGTKIPWHNVVWAAGITPKHAFSLWLAARSRLQTKDRVRHREIEDSCSFCATQQETALHLFFSCPFSATVWAEIRAWIGITRDMSTLNSGLKWLKKEAKGTSIQSKSKRITFATTVYHIWYARNRLVFEDEVPNPDYVIYRIKTHVYKVMYSLYPSFMINLENVAIGDG
ncbi:hypothetical protein DH2020_033531 [Rehmannia glutinosa]|uniref:Reverse transcriptase zinc-binding domain-containing protein n=1 Tax=Rehmannia glutinosa TaxID=99300 RepID=A0ABR0VCA0_REHGL